MIPYATPGFDHLSSYVRIAFTLITATLSLNLANQIPLHKNFSSAMLIDSYMAQKF